MLDELDRALLQLLSEDARRSHRELARLAGSTGPTVAARVARMEAAGIIEGYTLRVDKDAFGGGSTIDFQAPATVACHWCKRRSADPVWETVASRPHPFCCTTCRGQYVKRHAELEAKS